MRWSGADCLEGSSSIATLTDTALISAKRLVICLKYCSGVIATRSLYTIFLKPEKIHAQYDRFIAMGREDKAVRRKTRTWEKGKKKKKRKRRDRKKRARYF